MTGAISDHFDGRRFMNPAGPELHTHLAHYEGEMAVVFGKVTRNVSAE